ncbi:acyl-CoA N-acyltransferase [Zopfochytrium polystomum]|nr:acyl-CoA N-acyltransferase [Zopfochytrium polystomum]
MPRGPLDSMAALGTTVRVFGCSLSSRATLSRRCRFVSFPCVASSSHRVPELHVRHSFATGTAPGRPNVSVIHQSAPTGAPPTSIKEITAKPPLYVGPLTGWIAGFRGVAWIYTATNLLAGPKLIESSTILHGWPGVAVVAATTLIPWVALTLLTRNYVTRLWVDRVPLTSAPNARGDNARTTAETVVASRSGAPRPGLPATHILLTLEYRTPFFGRRVVVPQVPLSKFRYAPFANLRTWQLDGASWYARGLSVDEKRLASDDVMAGLGEVVKMQTPASPHPKSQSPPPSSSRVELSIRPFRPADQAAARALVLDGLEERWGTLDPSLNGDLEDIARSYYYSAESGGGDEDGNGDYGSRGVFLVAFAKANNTTASATATAQLVATGALIPEPDEEAARELSPTTMTTSQSATAQTTTTTRGATKARSTTARIVRMSVAAEHRGRGIGGQMLARLLEEARWRGYTRVVLETTKTWSDAARFYEGRGFRVVGEDEHDRHFSMDLC